jgi:nitrate reductase gamma subunit
MGSLARFDRDQYTWKSDSSQLLRAGSCAGAATCSTAASCSCSSATCSASSRRTGCTSLVITAPQKQLMAVVAGGVAGGLCFIGLTCCCTGACSTRASG